MSRVYAKVIKNASKAELKEFFKDNISPEVKIRTDNWSRYKPLKKELRLLEHVASGSKGNNFGDMHRGIMMIKA